MPSRIQRKRTRGWRMPPNAVYVGRGAEWGNPYIVGEPVQIYTPNPFSPMRGTDVSYAYAPTITPDLNPEFAAVLAVLAQIEEAGRG